MKRHKPRRTNPSQEASPKPPPEPCRAIVPVDGSAIRKKISKDYEKALNDLAESRRKLDEFQQQDVPQFTRWLNSHFGALLTELRELSDRIMADEELIFQVESELLFGGGSHGRAYKRVMEARENPAPPPPPPGGEPEPEPGRERERADTGPCGEDFEDFEEPMEAFFKSLFGESGPGSGPQGWPPGNQDSPGGFRPGPEPPPPGNDRLKQLYRALVRRLHPDTQQEMTAQKLEWWHQAQAAYQAGDAEQLEVILTLCEIGDSGTTRHTSASLLQRITGQLKRSLREIKRQLTGLRRDPAWGFARRSDHDVMLLQMRRTLTADLEELRARWRPIQELIAEWKTAAERVKPPRRKKPARQTQNTEFPF